MNGRFCSLGASGVRDSGVGDSGVGDFEFLTEWAILQFGRFWSGRFCHLNGFFFLPFLKNKLVDGNLSVASECFITNQQ